jgi:hypothetical protein
MMEARLIRFVELWSKSLESGLDEAAQTELDGFLQDPVLCEQLGSWQAQHSEAEGVEPAETPGLDKRVMERFHQRAMLRKAGPWVLGTVVALGAAFFAYQWASADAYRFVQVPAEEEGASAPEHNADKPRPTVRPTLGLPPGFGSRPTRLEMHIGRTVQLGWKLQKAAEARVTVMDRDGRPVKTLWQGKAKRGSYSSAWDGTDQQGRPAVPGTYKLTAISEGILLSEREIELSAGKE